MKRCFAILLTMILLFSSMLPVQSEGLNAGNFLLNMRDNIINNDTENARYEEALLQLKNHISKNEAVDLQKLSKEFDELGFYQASFMLSFYCKALDAVDSGNYERALSLIDVMDEDADFADFRLANPWIGTLEDMYEYIQGRQAEELWVYDEAVAHYSKCPDYRDSRIRKNGILDIRYQWALEAFFCDTAEGYEEAYALFTALGDYKESKAYAQKAQMMSVVLQEEKVSTYSASAKGYAGPVAVTLSINGKGKITSLEIGNDKFSESQGFGAKALEPAFIAQFIGLQVPVAMEDIDAISGATITTEAVIEAVNKAYKKSQQPAWMNLLPEADTFQLVLGKINRRLLFGSATVQGKVGPVFVEVIMQNDGTITSVNIGDENYAETPEYAAAVLEDAFKSQFIGKKAPFVISSGDPSANAANGYIGSARGFAGAVEVKVSFDESNKITSFAIVEESFNETPDYGGKALHPAFTGQFVGKQAPMELSDIDAVSRATITSTAVVDAVNNAYIHANYAPVDAVSGATVTSKAVVQAVNIAAVDTSMDWCYEGLRDGEVVGYVAQTTVKGYGGEMQITVGINLDQMITGIIVGGAGFSETPGLGAKAKEDKFTSQFIGKNAAESIGVIKFGNPKGDNDVDAITAATITSSAVAGGVNSIASYVTPLISNLPVVMVKPEVTYTSSGKGYTGPVDAEVGFDEDGSIVYLVVGQSERFAETDTIGGKCRDIRFTGQFIGLSGDVTVDEIDVISGATVTSEAVVSAVNKSYKKFLEANGMAADATVAEENDTAELETPEEGEPVADAVFSSSSKGYGGPVQVTVSFDIWGRITSLSIGGDKFAESQGIGDKVLEPAFAAQFIGLKAPVSLNDIDAISGASVTTEAVINAVNKAYDKFMGQ